MKRFYKDVTVSDAPYQILLDGRVVKTPMKVALALPNRALAEAVAAEWRGQGEELDPDTMPLTKFANTAIDRVGAMRADVVDQILAYANDLLCYRASAPKELVARQAAEWDPLLAWAKERYGAELTVQTGIVHFNHSDEAYAALRQAVEAFDPFLLAALHTTASILGSLVLALALADGRIDAETAYALSTLDERYQVEHWGTDAEAEARAAGLLEEIQTAERFMRLAK